MDEGISRVYISRDGILNEQDFGHKSEILKQDSSEIFTVHPKLETQSLVEHEQETERCLPTHSVYCYVHMVFCCVKS